MDYYDHPSHVPRVSRRMPSLGKTPIVNCLPSASVLEAASCLPPHQCLWANVSWNHHQESVLNVLRLE